MIPGPRPSNGHPSPLPGSGDLSPVALRRTQDGWAVVSAAGHEATSDLVEGMSLADLVAEELGFRLEPDRAARRSARGNAPADGPDDPAAVRIAALERIVSQLEHALAARVATERAIGVLAERHGLGVRAAFELLRRDARSQGRPVAELAREVLDSLAADTTADAPPAAPAPAGSADGRF